jgi:hypothetical protein
MSKTIWIVISICGMHLWAQEPNIVAQRRATSEVLQREPFDLLCTTINGHVTPPQGDRSDAALRWAYYAMLRDEPSFRLHYDGSGKLELTPTDSAPLLYLVSGADPDVSGRKLVQFEPDEGGDERRGGLYVRFPIDATSQSFLSEFVIVKHGKFSEDLFGAMAYTVATYQCATPQQVSAFSPERSGVDCVRNEWAPSGVGIVSYDCR